MRVSQLKPRREPSKSLHRLTRGKALLYYEKLSTGESSHEFQGLVSTRESFLHEIYVMALPPMIESKQFTKFLSLTFSFLFDW